MPGCPTFTGVALCASAPALSALWAIKPPDWNDPQLLWAALPLIAALLIGAGIIYFLDRWRKQADAPAAPNEDQLNHYRSLYERGVLNQDEFNRLRLLLGERMRKDLNLPEPTPPQTGIVPSGEGEALAEPAGLEPRPPTLGHDPRARPNPPEAEPPSTGIQKG